MDKTLLAGVRVLDLTRMYAGPYCGQMLADFGAEVIRVERPGGDVIRTGMVALKDAKGERTLESASYLSVNRNKKGITVDIATPEGQAIVKALAEKSDVLLENYKVGDLARYGLDYESIAAINPSIVYCSLTGFGQTGPHRARPGTDPIFQGRSGWMSVTGHADDAPGGGPMMTGIYAIDMFGGCYAAMGVLAALNWRQRNDNQGQHIDLVLLDVALATAAHPAMDYMLGGLIRPKMGSKLPGACPGGIFECDDGPIMALPSVGKQMTSFFTLLGVPEVLDDPRFAGPRDRLENREALEAIIFPRIKTWKREAFVEALSAASIPAGLINDFAQAVSDPQIVARGMIVESPHPTSGDGKVAMVANPIRFSKTPVATYDAPPTVGQHTDQVLADVLGFDQAKIDDLKARKVL